MRNQNLWVPVRLLFHLAQSIRICDNVLACLLGRDYAICGLQQIGRPASQCHGWQPFWEAMISPLRHFTACTWKLMNKNVKNVVLIMSGGSGQRFGAGVPKQYCMMGNRPIIDYAIDAARFCSTADQVVIVAAAEYIDEITAKYGFPATVGGKTRTESLANGLDFVAKNYDCEKIIIANAVCPLMTEEQLERYFGLLDDYDYVLTSWKVVSTLHRYDGVCVDRDDYFHVMEPEAYRFKMLHENYKRDYPVPYVFHQLPKCARGFFCFDYPYTMKITYPSDVKIAKLLYDDVILRPKQERIKQNVTSWLSSFCPDGVFEWYSRIPDYIADLVNKWQITSWSMNPKTFATCVFEAESRIHGSVILKFHAPSGRYQFELAYYRLSRNGRMAQLLDYNDDYRALLIKKIVPGMIVKFNAEDNELRKFYNDIAQNFISLNVLPKGLNAVTIKEDFETNASHSDMYNFHSETKRLLDNTVRWVWDKYFANSPMYYLHRDYQRRNILRGPDGIYAIDPLGIIGPMEFEFSLGFVIECRANPDECVSLHATMLDYFSSYCDKKRLLAAVFVQWVHKMDEYVFSKRDNRRLAEWCLKTIKTLFYHDGEISCDAETGLAIPITLGTNAEL